MADFGERVWYYIPGIKGREKMSPRWESGIWLGVRDESGEILIGTAEGVLKARSFMRKPESQQWNYEEFAGMQGVPWEPRPGHEGREIKSKLNIANTPIQPEIRVVSDTKSVRREKQESRCNNNRNNSRLPRMPGGVQRRGIKEPH